MVAEIHIRFHRVKETAAASGRDPKQSLADEVPIAASHGLAASLTKHCTKSGGLHAKETVPSKRDSPGHILCRCMYYDCQCGLTFAIVPREIPLSEPEAAYCENCGLEITGPRSPRYAEYIPINKAIEERIN
jgi:hypothetical protein